MNFICAPLRKYQHNQGNEYIHHHQKFPYDLVHPSLSHLPPPTDLLSETTDLFSTILQRVFKLLHVSIEESFDAEQNSIVQIHHNMFIHSPADEHLDCFQFLTVRNKAPIDFHTQVFQVYVKTFMFWCLPVYYQCSHFSL